MTVKDFIKQLEMHPGDADFQIVHNGDSLPFIILDKTVYNEYLRTNVTTSVNIFCNKDLASFVED